MKLLRGFVKQRGWRLRPTSSKRRLTQSRVEESATECNILITKGLRRLFKMKPNMKTIDGGSGMVGLFG